MQKLTLFFLWHSFSIWFS